MGGLAHPWISKISAKKVVFLVEWKKTNYFSLLLITPRKILKKSPSAPPWK